MPKSIDETGNTHGRLKVLTLAENTSRKSWVCRCSCGNMKTVEATKLRSGHTKSCGCILKELVGDKHPTYKHGQAASGNKLPSKTYESWAGMVSRCTNPTTVGYHRYGGRGIAVDPRWLKFENFLADMGERPAGLTLDRVDNDLNYSKENCKWSSKQGQAANRSNVLQITYAGKTQILAEWARELKLPYNKLYHLTSTKKLTLESAIEHIRKTCDG